MENDEKTKPRLEIAHVLFIDIVGYSKLLTDEQSEALQELNQIVRSTEAAQEAEAAGQQKSTRLNSSHSQISYAVFCLKKKKHHTLLTYVLRSKASMR